VRARGRGGAWGKAGSGAGGVLPVEGTEAGSGGGLVERGVKATSGPRGLSVTGEDAVLEGVGPRLGDSRVRRTGHEGALAGAMRSRPPSHPWCSREREHGDEGTPRGAPIPRVELWENWCASLGCARPSRLPSPSSSDHASLAEPPAAHRVAGMAVAPCSPEGAPRALVGEGGVGGFSDRDRSDTRHCPRLAWRSRSEQCSQR